MYKIIGADGREYGPVPAETVQLWIRGRRADAATRIRLESASEWTTVGSLPEFAEALQPVPPPVLTVPPAPPTYPGVASPTNDPGPSPLPLDVGERDYSLELGNSIGRSWALLTGPKMWMVIGGMAVWIAIQFGIAILAQIPLIGLLFSLASIVVGGALTGGLYAFMLRWVRGQQAEIDHLFDGFRYCFVQLFLGQLVMGLLIFATIIPGTALIVAGAVMLGNEVAIPAAIALCAVGGIAAMVPLIYLAVSWSMTLPLIMDKRLEFWPAMQLSRRVVCKHWWSVAAMLLVSAILSGVGVLACFVGVFFTAPLGTAVRCYAYDTLFGPRAAAAPVQPTANPFLT